MAAQALVRESYRDPMATYATNVMGTAALLQACRSRPNLQGLVIVTSDKVYENHGAGRAFEEADRLGGHDPYSNSKACTELLTQSFRDSFFADGPPIATARAGNVIGGGDWSQDRLIPDCVRALKGGTPGEPCATPTRSVRGSTCSSLCRGIWRWPKAWSRRPRAPRALSISVRTRHPSARCGRWWMHSEPDSAGKPGWVRAIGPAASRGGTRHDSVVGPGRAGARLAFSARSVIHESTVVDKRTWYLAHSAGGEHGDIFGGANYPVP